MEKITLKAEVRDELGKGACKQLRKKGIIPGIIYKDGEKGVSVQIDTKALWHALHTEAGENAIITMDISDGSGSLEKTVILQEMQIDPVKDTFVHVDFREISLKDKLKVKVPVALKGEAIGVTEEEGVLSQISWELEVECLPTAIPEHINVNVEGLRINDAIHVKDLTMPEGVEVLEDPDQVVVSVHPPQAEEEEAPEEGLEEEGAEPEVIKKGKGEEEGEEAEDGGKEEKEG